jgi:putative ABC transport system ATP-binding protein
MTAVLEADRLYRFFHAGDDETLALQGVSLSVAAGELVAVTGPSGSGKSTLLACLAGLDEPDGGTVTIAGRRINRRPEAERAAIRARSVGILYQQANLVGHLTVEANLALAQRLANADDAAARRRTLLERVGLGKHMRAQPRELSGGELARAGLALALANDPELVLADEPTGELDDANAARMLDLLRERAEAGASVLVATHDPAVAEQADQMIRLRDGKVEL